MCDLLGVTQPLTGLGHGHGLTTLKDMIIRVEGTSEGLKFSGYYPDDTRVKKGENNKQSQASSYATKETLPTEGAMNNVINKTGEVKDTRGKQCGRLRKRPVWWKDYVH